MEMKQGQEQRRCVQAVILWCGCGLGREIKEEYMNSVVEVKRVSDKIVGSKLEIEGVVLNVVIGRPYICSMSVR